ncbi:protein kinase [Streptomyces sp. NPDC086835]|uniref:protein kinase domain-containing protein n=1 Tax=Streptomyces sp. NPDC086835 TaxID=3365761 RepID=UPI00380B3120
MLAPLTHTDPVTIGSFTLLARLGHGGMGTVYLARTAGGRTVALKTMHATIAADPAARTRFHLETDAARVIGGHHGATVVDADPTAETPWLATEYVLGPPLDDAVDLCGPLPETSVRAIGAALAGALTQLHASDVVHRDLKPSNVMITAYGPKIIDFGIARAAGDDRLTRTGTAAGTPAYMSPEQATGQEHTPAGDTFALAGVLVYAATGHPPFGTGQAADLLYRVRYTEPDLTLLPPALAPILARCLAKDPTHRPTTQELTTQLHNGQGQFADHLPPTLLTDIARRATHVWHHPPHRLPAPQEPADQDTGTAPLTPLPRRRLLRLAGGTAVAAAALGAGTWTWFNNGSGDKDGKPDAKPSPTTPPAPKGDWLWRLPLSTSEAALRPPAPLRFGASLVIADDNGMRTINVSSGGTEIASLLKAPVHRCASDEDRVYGSEPGVDGNGPLVIRTVKSGGPSLTPDAVELKDLNGGLAATQLLCAKADVVYLAAGRGDNSGQEIGYGEGQQWFLLAVDVHTGKTLWKQPLPAMPAASRRLHFLAARVSEDHLVLTQETPAGKVKLSVRDARTGKLRWEQPLAVSDPDDIQGLLEVDLVHVYPPTGQLRALALADGKQKWTFGVGRAQRRTGPPAVGEWVYAVEEGQGLVALDFVTGELQWREKGGAGADSDITLPPVPGYAYVYSYSSKTGLMRAVDEMTGAPGKSFKAFGERFFAYDGIPERIIGMGKDFFAGYELR